MMSHALCYISILIVLSVAKSAHTFRALENHLELLRYDYFSDKLVS